MIEVPGRPQGCRWVNCTCMKRLWQGHYDDTTEAAGRHLCHGGRCPTPWHPCRTHRVMLVGPVHVCGNRGLEAKRIASPPILACRGHCTLNRRLCGGCSAHRTAFRSRLERRQVGSCVAPPGGDQNGGGWMYRRGGGVRMPVGEEPGSTPRIVVDRRSLERVRRLGSCVHLRERPRLLAYG